MTNNELSWQEFCLIGIQEKGGTEVQFASITEDITAMDWGEKDIESSPLVNGGRIIKRRPMGDEGITFRIYPLDAGLDGNGMIQFFHPQATDDTTQPIAVSNSHKRKLFRIVLLWSSQLPEGPTEASTPPDSGEEAYRVQIFNAYMTSYKPSFDDKILSAEVTFKWAPFDKYGNPNKTEESTDGSVQLPDVTSF